MIGRTPDEPRAELEFGSLVGVSLRDGTDLDAASEELGAVAFEGIPTVGTSADIF